MWEYVVLFNLSQYDLDAWGSAGWELVAVTYIQYNAKMQYIFKRPLKE